MAKYGTKDMTVTLDDAPGGAPQALTNFIIEGFEITIESLMEELSALGDEWEEQNPVGMRRVPPFTLTTYMDDTASTGTVAILSVPDSDPNAVARNCVVEWGGATFTLGVRLAQSTFSTAKGQLQRIVAEIMPTGSLAIT